MTSVTKTIDEARNYILKRIDSIDDTDMKTWVLEMLNYAIIDIVTAHNWELLQRKTTLTYSTNDDHLITLPSDCDRIIVLRPTASNGKLLPLEGVSPTELEKIKARYSYDTPRFYCSYDFSQSTTATVPHQRIEVYSEPSDGDVFTLWYIQHIEELTETDASKVPPIPPPIWRMIIKSALVECLEMTSESSVILKLENLKLMKMMDDIKSREKLSTSQPREIKSSEYERDWKAYRMAKL